MHARVSLPQQRARNSKHNNNSKHAPSKPLLLLVCIVQVITIVGLANHVYNNHYKTESYLDPPTSLIRSRAFVDAVGRLHMDTVHVEIPQMHEAEQNAKLRN